jgi:hypothetical protein
MQRFDFGVAGNNISSAPATGLKNPVGCDSYTNKRFGGIYRLHHQGEKSAS